MAVKNICDCDNPPGGRVVCEPHQMAVCGFINGVEVRECFDPPSGGPASLIVNWALGKILGAQRAPNDPISATDIPMLTQEKYISLNGELVKFKLPQQVSDAMKAMLVVPKRDDGSANDTGATI